MTTADEKRPPPGNEPVPDEHWLPLKRRIEWWQRLVMVATACMVIGGIALISAAWAPSWVALHVGAPLGILGVVLGYVSLSRGRRNLAKMRQLIIHYCGIDPDPAAKQYPPGCTCIRGALTDNPSCPHHRSTL